MRFTSDNGARWTTRPQSERPRALCVVSWIAGPCNNRKGEALAPCLSRDHVFASFISDLPVALSLRRARD